jgi:hypothetical protein
MRSQYYSSTKGNGEGDAEVCFRILNGEEFEEGRCCSFRLGVWMGCVEVDEMDERNAWL